MNSLISVVVPVYNVEKYLNKCIDSLVSQTYENLEIILIDDGSKDKSAKICDKWKDNDSRIKVIHKENGGLSEARNVGIDYAQGEYIAFIDSDDWVDKNFIKYLHEKLEKYNADIAASTIIKTYKDYNEIQPINREKIRFTSEEALDTLLSGRDFCAVAWNKLYKKNVIGNIRFPIGKIHEDEFFSYKVIANANTLVLVPEAIYYYRQRSGSIMQKWSTAHLDALEAFKERMDFMCKYYPKLYLKSKYSFLISIFFNVKELLDYDGALSIEDIDRVIDAKENLKFKKNELTQLGIKNIVLMLRVSLLIRNLKKQKKNIYK